MYIYIYIYIYRYTYTHIIYIYIYIYIYIHTVDVGVRAKTHAFPVYFSTMLQLTVDFRNFIVFFWAETLAH